MTPVTGNVISSGFKLIDSLFTSDEERDAAKLKLTKLAQDGQLKELEIGMSAIIAEANSTDPWTSRARPSFLYVMYIMILTAIPMGILSAFQPEIATRIADGLQQWLTAIPSEMWGLFGVGYTGYAATRTYDKHSKNKAGK
jgi:hypothetical protein